MLRCQDRGPAATVRRGSRLAGCQTFRRALTLLGLDDPRAGVRYPCDRRLACRLVGADDNPVEPVQLQNLSAGGAALVVPRRLPVAGPATIVFRNAERGDTCIRHGRIVRLERGRGGTWVAGVAFAAELSACDLGRLL